MKNLLLQMFTVKCTIHVSSMLFTVCGVATAGSGSIHVQLVFEGQVLVEGFIKGYFCTYDKHTASQYFVSDALF